MRLQSSMSLFVFLVVGCSNGLQLGDNNDGGPTGPGSGPAPSAKCLGDIISSGFESEGGVDPATCATDCEDAAVQGCQMDPTAAKSDCSALCSKSAVKSQVTCLQDTPCPALLSALNGQSTLCGFPNAGGGSVAPACCAQSCEYAAIVGCNVDTDTANSECVNLCSSSPNHSQLDCVQNVSCADLLGALSGQGTVCGIAAPGGG
jgi:hypothetical protein